MIADERMASGSTMSFGQERLWWLQHLQPADAGYNRVITLEFTPDVVASALRGALDEIVARHDVLRSVFVADASGMPHQTVVDHFSFPLIDLDRTTGEEPHAVARGVLSRP